MNERFHLDLFWPATTQAAEGMPRRPWTIVTRAEGVAMGLARLGLKPL